MIVLLRHASAGDRLEWNEDDRLRPLDERGFAQAERLVEPLLALGVKRVFSSPYLRCTQTVEPLARCLGKRIRIDDALAEGAPLRDTMLLLAATKKPSVFCTHGDVVLNVLDKDLKKGAAAVLELDGGTVRRIGKIKAP